MSTIIQPARTYNQNHVARKYMPGKRRISIYWTWSYPWESNRELTEMDNRFSTMTEVRRVAWPNFEATDWDRMNFLQGIAGTLELFHRSALDFQRVAGEASGHPVAVFQRIDQAVSNNQSTSGFSRTAIRYSCSASTTWLPSRKQPQKKSRPSTIGSSARALA